MSNKIEKMLSDYINSNSIFSINKFEKNKYFNLFLNLLTNHHISNCYYYNKICKFLGFKKKKNNFNLEKLPFIPVSLFKSLDLVSTKKKIVKIMNSSGTNNDQKSRIFLDKNNSINQTIVLKKIFFEVTNFKTKVPMLIIDKKNEIFNSNSFSARTAAVLGFSKFTSNHLFVVKEDDSIDQKSLTEFLKKFKDRPFLIFGFTSYLWKFFVTNLAFKKANLSNATIIHGGGWKKLESNKVSNQKFKNLIKKKFKIPLNRIFNYYGMIEQTGSIFFECEKNEYFHTSKFSNLIIRNNKLENVGMKEKGIIQLLSLLPLSYPGHNILTEDLGIILGEDDCSCGKKGKYFKVLGRLKNSEIRGCSDANH